jgi:hypothetical protein
MPTKSLNRPQKREVSKNFLDQATRLIRFAKTEEEVPKELCTCQLTPEADLRLIFPVIRKGTLYHHFSTTTEATQVVAFINPDLSEARAAKALEEAALGMQDNLYFH